MVGTRADRPSFPVNARYYTPTTTTTTTTPSVSLRTEMARYRWPTVITAASALVLSAFSLWWIFIAYTDYRSLDFKRVSAGRIDHTCVEAVSDDQLKAARYDKVDWSCTSNSKIELSNLLAVSVHAMYSANRAKPYQGDAKGVYDAVILATQGTQGATESYPITHRQAYAALSVLGRPSSTDCATMYNRSAEGDEPNPTAPSVVCDAAEPESNFPLNVTADLDVLYTHCVHQFSFARSYPDSGTFGIPKVGKDASPLILPIITSNSTIAWQDRARILVGTRWGYATVFYTVAMLATAFFLMDCTVFLLAELTRVDSYLGTHALDAKRERP